MKSRIAPKSKKKEKKKKKTTPQQQPHRKTKPAHSKQGKEEEKG